MVVLLNLPTKYLWKNKRGVDAVDVSPIMQLKIMGIPLYTLLFMWEWPGTSKYIFLKGVIKFKSLLRFVNG